MLKQQNYVPFKEVMQTMLYEAMIQEVNEKLARQQNQANAVSMVTKTFCEEFVTSVVDRLTKELVDGKKVNIGGVGILQKSLYAPKFVRNPKTNEKLAFTPKMRLKFKVSETISYKLNIGRK